MRKVIYVIRGIETASYQRAKELEKTLGTKAIIKMIKCDEDKPQLSPLRKAMLEQFGYVHPSLKNKVQLG